MNYRYSEEQLTKNSKNNDNNYKYIEEVLTYSTNLDKTQIMQTFNENNVNNIIKIKLLTSLKEDKLSRQIQQIIMYARYQKKNRI